MSGTDVVTALWFFLPAGLANMSPVLVSKLPGLRQWRTPMDFGHTYRGRRLLGDNKTWRGLITGTLLAGVVALILSWSGANAAGLTAKGAWWALGGGLSMGFGALLGDAVESFLKRRSGVAPGDSWFPFDQIDYIAGGLLLVYPLTHPSLQLMLYVLGLYWGLHLVTSYVGYLLGLKSKPI